MTKKKVILLAATALFAVSGLNGAAVWKYNRRGGLHCGCGSMRLILD